VVDGRPKKIFYGENDSCCVGFRQVGSWLDARKLQREGAVGNGRAKLMRSRDVADTVVEELRDDPCRFLHRRGSGCEECDETWVSVVGTGRMVVETSG
jgi:aminoglycoside N3'-acetyltransferase